MSYRTAICLFDFPTKAERWKGGKAERRKGGKAERQGVNKIMTA